MKNLYNVTTAGFVILLAVFMIPQQSAAQWSLGLSYQIRDEAPQNGFGAQLERSLLGKAPLVDLRLRAHFSYFSEENYASPDGITYGTIENYDYGVAGVGGVSIGLIAPYVGVGLGSTTLDLQDAQIPDNEGSESSLYWNGFIGAELSPIPKIKPFVEYRLQSAQSLDELQNSVEQSDGRLIFGVSFSF